jgi:sugar lactone lactonase YvrE
MMSLIVSLAIGVKRSDYSMNRKRFSRLWTGLVLVAVLAGAPLALAQDGALPDRIDVEREGFHPEGIEYDAAGERFLLGSLTEGTIFAVTDDSTITPFIEDPDLLSSVGIHIDVAGGRLLVANVDRGVLAGEAPRGPAISLLAYDLESGERLFFTDLTTFDPEAGHFANDVTVDPDGNAYVTDSFFPVIYKVDPEGEASIFLQNEAFASDQFGLNGIDYHPDGYLLVARSDTGALFKVPLDDPEAFAQVELDTPVFGADGIVLRPDGALAVVGQNQSVFLVRSEDGWQTGSIVEAASLEQPATTAAIREGEVYAIFAQLAAMGSDDPPDVFPIVRVPFEDTGAEASGDAGDDAGADAEAEADAPADEAPSSGGDTGSKLGY